VCRDRGCQDVVVRAAPRGSRLHDCLCRRLRRARARARARAAGARRATHGHGYQQRGAHQLSQVLSPLPAQPFAAAAARLWNLGSHYSLKEAHLESAERLSKP